MTTSSRVTVSLHDITDTMDQTLAKLERVERVAVDRERVQGLIDRLKKVKLAIEGECCDASHFCPFTVETSLRAVAAVGE